MNRSLNDVLRDMVVHAQENPEHGYNCACKDTFIREARAMLIDPRVRHEAGYLFTAVLR